MHVSTYECASNLIQFLFFFGTFVIVITRFSASQLAPLHFFAFSAWHFCAFSIHKTYVAKCESILIASDRITILFYQQKIKIFYPNSRGSKLICESCENNEAFVEHTLVCTTKCCIVILTYLFAVSEFSQRVCVFYFFFDRTQTSSKSFIFSCVCAPHAVCTRKIIWMSHLSEEFSWARFLN